jgi:hypothetical protein
MKHLVNSLPRLYSVWTSTIFYLRDHGYVIYMVAVFFYNIMLAYLWVCTYIH